MAISHIKVGAAGRVVVRSVVSEDVGIGVTNDDVGGSTVGGEFD